MPKQPFLNWLMEADSKPNESLTLAEFQKDSDAFLIPDDSVIGATEEAIQWVEALARLFRAR
ncbi:MAG TPA: hypothetical protein VLU73_12745 [Methylococcaceae bacterium]|nr:hypothetical protein [Methylococcaceae bacterium]